MIRDALSPLRFRRRRPVHRRPRHLAVAVATAVAGVLVVGGVAYGGSNSTGPRVTVRAGDTLWVIAAEHAPDGDVQGYIAEIEAANHLSGTAITPGEVLDLPAP